MQYQFPIISGKCVLSCLLTKSNLDLVHGVARVVNELARNRAEYGALE